jgi:phosphoenolpyruvate carboxykinase (ATP)
VVYQVNGSRVEWNPSPARLRELTEEMPNASVTEFGNVNVKARVDSRSTRSTYLVDDSTNSRGQTITRAEYDRVAARQDAHIAKRHMVVVDGYIGSDPQFRTKARLIMEAANANVAGMQQQLYYPTEGGYDPHRWDPDTTVIYTPNLEAPGYPDDRLIAVDLNASITRVLNSDYFGESKKGGLRTRRGVRRHGGPPQAGAEGVPRLLPRPGRVAGQIARVSWSNRSGETEGNSVY